MAYYNVQTAITLAGLIVSLKHMLLMQILKIQIVLMKKSKSITQLTTTTTLKNLKMKKTIQQLILHYQNLLNTFMSVDNVIKNTSFEMHCLLIYRHKKQKMKLIAELKNIQMKRSLLFLLLSRQLLTN